MSSVAQVLIHSSQFPERVRQDLLESLRTRQVNHKFHYDSFKQTQKWLAVHQACSPARTDPNCALAYDQAFQAAAARIGSRAVHLLGLGCGGGQKDTRLLSILRGSGRRLGYTPLDVSTAMVLVARSAALAVLPEADCFPVVCDLSTADDLPEVLASRELAGTARLITFFGMLPNFEPRLILRRLSALVRPGDHLLFSANLTPGPDYAAGLQRILPQYDNPQTADWLLTFLLDLGVEPRDGELRFGIEDAPDGLPLQRVAARFRFSRLREICVDDERFQFRAGDEIRLFFSYRHTPGLVRTLLGEVGLQVIDEWITPSEEEGVFLVVRTGTPNSR